MIGGRNVGDEYFSAGESASYADVDLIAVGPVVNDVSASFDAYWSSGSAYPADRILGTDKQKSDLQRDADHAARAAEAQQYIQAIEKSDYARALLARQLRYEWAPVRMEADDPAKGLTRAAPDELLWPKLKVALGEPRRRLQLVSAYFVPTQARVDAFTRMARQGVEVTVLTNSFEATDVPLVHSGYAKWRKTLLLAGVHLYEMRKPSNAPGGNREVTALGSSGSGARGAASALHAKTFAVRSAILAEQMDRGLADFVSRRAFKVELANGELRWVEQGANGRTIYPIEPGSTWRSRALLNVLSHLPIEWLL